MLKHFWRVIELGLNSLDIEDDFNTNLQILQEKYTKEAQQRNNNLSTKATLPLPAKEIGHRKAIVYFDLLCDRLYQNRLSILSQIPDLEAEVYQFLLIDKNREFLQKLVGGMVDLDKEINQQIEEIENHLINRFQQEIFKEAFLICSKQVP